MEKRYCPYCMSAVEDGKACGHCGLTRGAYTPAEHHVPPGTILMDRYLVGRVLGEGGFGITYIGCDLRLELKVAIKEYFPMDKVARHALASMDVSVYIGAEQSYEIGKSRFLKEAQTMALMDKQPEIVSVRDFFETNNTAYIVMEYVEGTTLKELVKQRGGKIPPQELFEMIEPLFGALTALHAKRLIHRDISPDNLMLEKNKIRLIDFGCSREAVTGQENTLTVAVKHGYAPIEQYNSSGQGPWTDVYALSATIYYCLTGIAPPRSPDRALEDELLLPRRLGIDLTEAQEKALLHGMEFQPRKRIRSIEEFYGALYKAAPVVEDTDEDNKVIVEVEQKPARTKRDIIAVAGVVALLMMLCGILAYGQRQREEALPPVNPVISEEVTVEEVLAELEALRDEAHVWMGDQEYSLRTALSNGKVPAVAVADEKTINQNSLTINKPLFIKEGGTLSLEQQLIVNGTTLYIEGSLNHHGLLQTVNGGKIIVAEGGWMYGSGLLWLEQEGDLTILDGAEVQDTFQQESRQHMVLSEEELTSGEGVYRVSNMTEWKVALDESWGKWDRGEKNNTIKSIVLEEDIAIDRLEYRGIFGVPLIIEEGVTLTVLEGEAEEAFFLGDGCSLINHGTIRARVNGGEGGNHKALINYGTIEKMEHNDENGVEIMLNMGQMEFSDGQFRHASLYNFGEVNIKGSWCDMMMEVCNVGDFNVRSDDDQLRWFHLTNDGWFWNPGHLYVEDQVEFCMNTTLVNLNEVIMGPGSRLVGEGIFDNYGNLQINTDDIEFGGTLLHSIHGQYNFWEQENNPIHTLIHPSNDPYGVSNGQELDTALSDDTVSVISLDHFSIDGSLTLSKGSYLSGDQRLIADGDMTIRGEDAYLYLDGHLDMNGHALYLEEGATLINAGGISNCSGVEVGRDSRVFLYASIEMQENSVFHVADNSQFIALADFNFQGTELQVEGYFQSHGGLDLNACWLHVLSGGGFRIDDGEIFFDENTQVLIDEGGHMTLNNWDWQSSVLDGELSNYGHLEILNGIIINGLMDNYGECYGPDYYEEVDGQVWMNKVEVYGTLNNFGTIRGNFAREESGRISGSPIENNMA